MTGRSLVDKLSSVLMAGVVALIVWLLATEESRPMRSVDSFPAGGEPGLTVTVRNAPEGRAAYDLAPRTVRLSLRGVDEALRALEPEDFSATVDLAGIDPAAESVTREVQVQCPSCAREGVRVTDWQPRQVSLRLGRAISDTRRVVAMPGDESPAGFTRGYQITPPEVTLHGAEGAVARVHEVIARLGEVGNPRGSGSVPAAPVLALDEAGQPLPDVAVEPGTVAVSVLLRRRDVEVAVSPEVKGADALADGYYLTGISVAPQFVQLDGETELVQPIRERGSVVTRPLDVTGMSGDVSRRVPLVLPRGVTAVNAPEGVTVTVKLEPLPGTVTREVALRPEGLEAGLALGSLTPDKVTVLVSGPRPLLEQLDEGDVQAVLDLRGLEAGAHRLRPKIRLPAEITQRSVTPDEVEVVLRESGPTPPRPTPRGTR